MSGEQIHLQVPPKLFGTSVSWIAQIQNSRPLVRRQKMSALIDVKKKNHIALH